MQCTIMARPCGAALALLLTVCLGCGGGGVVVEGEITLGGKPVDSGSITFVPADGAGPSTGGSISAGRYELPETAQVQPGKKVVRITAIMKTGKKIEAGRPAPPGTMVDEIKTFTIPPQEAEVVAGQINQLPFNLKP